MKKIFVLFFIFFTISIVFAHSPSDITISYDGTKDNLKVIIKHSLKTSPEQDPNKHYIKSVELKINGKLFKTNTFTKQSSVEEQITNFDKINLNKDNKDSKITIKATCNIVGSKTKNFVIKNTMKK